jgi:hypothetical protein
MKAYSYQLKKKTYEEEQANFYSRWMELNWVITIVTTCKYLGLGKERANRLFNEIRKEMARFNSYDDYEYSMKELRAELERLEIPLAVGTSSPLGANYDLHYRDRMNRKNETKNLGESLEAARMLQVMKNLM